MSRRLRRAIGIFGIAAVVVLVSAALVAWRAWPGTVGAGHSPTPVIGLASPTLSPTASASKSATTTPWTTASPTPPTLEPTSIPSPSAVLIGAGDICRLSSIADAGKTAVLISTRSTARVFTLGDNSNDSGTADEYATCYGATWGAFKSRTSPTAGNHDQMTSHGAPYYAYFGSAAGTAGKGYYSYGLVADWHVIVLNAICGEVGGCDAGSPEETWLKADLAANAGKHILAMWHIPEFSSGGHGNTTAYRAWWDDLYVAHADVVLNGHDHDYERYAQQSPAGAADPNGIREFVVGTGGASHTSFVTIRANSEKRNDGTFGVLELTLKLDSYGWQFIPIEGGTFTDSGETATHS